MLSDLKQRAMELPGQEIRTEGSTLRVGYWRKGRDASPKDAHEFHFYRWDARRRRHFTLTEAEAQTLLDSEED